MKDVLAQLEEPSPDLDLLSDECAFEQWKQWKEEAARLKELTAGLGTPEEWPAETKRTEHPRAEWRSKNFLTYVARLNMELREDREAPLQLAEAIMLCMYTGPLSKNIMASAEAGRSRARSTPSCGAGS